MEFVPESFSADGVPFLPARSFSVIASEDISPLPSIRNDLAFD
jgi:hypothetical protein